MRSRWFPVLVAAVVFGGFGVAFRPTPAAADPVVPAERILCRSFPYDPHAQPEIDTRDTTRAVGQWVVAQEDRGWQVRSVSPQVVVKATGALEAWAHVCVSPLR